MQPRRRGILGLLCFAVLVNAVLWLDSLDRYLGTRYHLPLSAYLPESAFTPSRALLAQTQALSPLALWFRAPGQAGGQTDPSASPAHGEAEGEDRRTDANARGSASGVDQAGPASTRDAPFAHPGRAGPTSPAASAPGGGPSAPGELAAAAPGAVTGGSTPATSAQGGRSAGTPRILFAGDSMMQGVAPIAIAALRKRFPDGYYVDLSRQSTGLTVRRYFDWPTRIRQEVREQRFDTVVIFLGPNDPWDIYEDGKRLRFPSEAWTEKYRERVREVLDFARSQKVRVVWIGLPSMRDDRLRRGAEIGNSVFREEANSFGFDYLSTEELIGRLDEPFKKYIDDPNRGRLSVRAEDGIHFTSTGLRLISARLVELIAERVRG